MFKNVILLSGRPGSGKTQMLIAYANLYPTTTVIISEESTKEQLEKRGLNSLVKVLRAVEYNPDQFNNSLSTVCIDYLELFDKNVLKKIVMDTIRLNIKIVLLSQMKRNGEINNFFADLCG